jgi:NAD(P)-dependent dehydrogenase (short-subunit alcohol dehydrogenase family)
VDSVRCVGAEIIDGELMMSLGPGTTVVITGGNAGIGLATAAGVARTGARVILAVRSAARGAAAIDQIKAAVPQATVDVMALDLSSLQSIASFTTSLGERIQSLDVLINNAGVTMKDRHLTSDGFEMTFGVNHLGHFALTAQLHALLAAANAPRVVVVASDAHRFARKGLNFDDLMYERRYRVMGSYGASKLANILFTREAARRWAVDGISVNCLHPGFVATRLGRDGDGGRLGEIAATVLKPFAKSPERGAATSVFLATSPAPEGVSGEYYVNGEIKNPSAHARDDSAAVRLWDVSSKLVGVQV